MLVSEQAPTKTNTPAATIRTENDRHCRGQYGTLAVSVTVTFAHAGAMSEVILVVLHRPDRASESPLAVQVAAWLRFGRVPGTARP